MKRPVQAALLLAVAVTTAGIVLNDTYLNLVRPTMRWPLLATAAILAACGVTLLLAPGDDHGHDHRASRMGLALALPFVAMAVVPITPLTSWSADRSQVEMGGDPSGTFDPLPADEVLSMNVSDFVDRATFDSQSSLTGRKVRLVGFVSPDGDGWAVTRIRVKCCAADARPFKVGVVGTPAPPKDSWVEVVGTWVARPPYSGEGPVTWPQLRDAVVKPVPAEPNPYE
ncbi:TIGR03943 family putative permease subunit [Arsenicicoccus dermatophilus]|uniref:TIGR03943 family putative permease subunit n=1 Tax=Arsenicicoccus dermatophilus TaxID=1076331 RepID=UPI003916E03F